MTKERKKGDRISYDGLSESGHKVLQRKVKKESPKIDNMIRVRVEKEYNKFDLFFEKDTSKKKIKETIKRILNRNEK